MEHITENFENESQNDEALTYYERIDLIPSSTKRRLFMKSIGLFILYLFVFLLSLAFAAGIIYLIWKFPVLFPIFIGLIMVNAIIRVIYDHLLDEELKNEQYNNY